ncbi:hypothetical protein ACFV2H_35680 [Streptomyces sp. NPDC059629]|uniref:hypothetical protein n=1 Tax=Streptomyces sp. NPDC059629 TaxID=3346889 RepID=UPI0036A2749D
MEAGPIRQDSGPALSGEALLLGGDALPGCIDLDLGPRQPFPGVDLIDVPTEDRLCRAMSAIGMVADRMRDYVFEFEPGRELPQRLETAIARHGGREAVAAALTHMMRHRMGALVATVVRNNSDGGYVVHGADALPQPGRGPALVVTPHVGPELSVPLHLAVTGAQVAMPTHRYAVPSPYLVLARLPEIIAFPRGAGLRVVPVPHRLGMVHLSSAVRRGMHLIWQPDTALGGAAQGASVELDLLGVTRRVSVFPHLMVTRYRMPVVIAYSRLVDDGSSDGRVEFHYRSVPMPQGTGRGAFFARLQDEVTAVLEANTDQWTQCRRAF